MPPSDQEPRYRLVDSNGNVVGALWGDGNGNVKIADETDTQTTFGPDGISTPALEADDLLLTERGSGTITVPAGGQTEVTAAGFGELQIVEYEVATNPGADAELRLFREADSGNGVQTWELEEKLGQTDVTVDYRVYNSLSRDTL
jgi:hypothetical protein